MVFHFCIPTSLCNRLFTIILYANISCSQNLQLIFNFYSFNINVVLLYRELAMIKNGQLQSYSSTL